VKYQIRVTGEELNLLWLTVLNDVPNIRTNNIEMRIYRDLKHIVSSVRGDIPYSKKYVMIVTEYELYTINDMIQKSTHFDIDERSDFKGCYKLCVYT